jgi:stage III sporulation protein AG
MDKLLKTLGNVKNMFKTKNPNTLIYIVVLFAAGIFLLTSGRFNAKSEEPPAETIPEQESAAKGETDYETALELRLKNILELAEGAGKVEVMLKISLGREIVVGSNNETDISDTKETDGEGGTREIHTESKNSETIINDGKPLILKEVEPQIEGVVIIAQGGGNAQVAADLSYAAQTVLGIEAHRVHILKMKGE